LLRVLVCGSGGNLGRILLINAPNKLQVIGLNHQELDITNTKQLKQQISFYKPNFIINASALTVEKAQLHSALAFAINQQGVENLACFNIPIIHISTDYVFDGNKLRPYLETDATNPLNVYGKSKLVGEMAIIRHNPQHIVIRSSWLLGEIGDNFLTKILHLAQNNSAIKMVTDQIGCPLSYEALAKVLWQLVMLYQKQGDLKWGIYHYAGKKKYTRYELAELILQKAYEMKIIKFLPKLIAINSKDYQSSIKRPLNCQLNSSLFCRTFKVELPNFSDDLLKILYKIKTDTPQKLSME